MDFKQNMGEEIAATIQQVGFDVGGEHTLQYYFYFSDEDSAAELGTSFEADGFEFELAESTDGDSWLCILRHDTEIDVALLTALGRRFTDAALELGGEFDGWERVPETGDRVSPAIALLGGLQHYEAGEFEEAVALFQQAAEELPNEVLPLLGLAYLQLGRAADAAPVFEQVVADDPESTEHRLNLGVALHMLTRYQEAIALYNKVLEMEPDNPSAHYNLACAFAKLNDLPTAMSHLQKAVDWLPQFAAQAKEDPDLEVLTQLPEFQKL